MGAWSLVLTEYVAMLQVCGDTPVGSDMIRGISGGQKKRVTTGKLNPTYKVLLVSLQGQLPANLA